jgi:colicin import membrane protein
VAPPPPPPAPRADADIATSKRTPPKEDAPRPEKKAEKKPEPRKPEPKKPEPKQPEPKKADPKDAKAKDKPLTQAERRAEQRRAEAERRRLEAEIRAEEARVEALRKDTLNRMQDELRRTGPGNATTRATSPTGKGDVTAAPSAAYAGRIVARVRPNIVLTESVRGNPAAEVEVRAAPDGTILGQKLLSSSGNDDWDRAVLRAVEKTEMLPRDVDGRVPPVLVITFRPSD